MMTKHSVAPLAGLLALAAACGNPTVNPESTFSVEGRALDAAGSPLSGATVRVVRHYHAADLFRPSVETLFACTSTDWKVCGDEGVNFEVAVVTTGVTGSDGRFSMSFKGKDIQAANGTTDAMGNVEGSWVEIVVLDPSDDEVGVFSYRSVFTQADKVFGAGDLRLWDSGARVDLADAVTSGQLSFEWNKLDRGTQGSNIYRVDIGDPSSGVLVVRCKEGQGVTEGGCSDRGEKLSVEVSAFSVYTFYSNAGAFSGYVTGDGVDFRVRAKFEAVGTFQPPNRVPVGIVGVWAVTDITNQDLLGTPATDGNPRTQQTIDNRSQAVYVLLNGSPVSDAGILNGSLNDANVACISVEFTTDLHGGSVDTAKRSGAGWTQKGRFCGGRDVDRHLSAVINFESTQVAGWLRYVIEKDGTGTGTPYFLAIGEIAVYR